MKRRRKKWRPSDMLDRHYLKELELFVDRIYDVALANDWTWTELARRAGVSYGSVANLGNRTSQRPQLRTIYRLAKAVGMALELRELEGRLQTRAA